VPSILCVRLNWNHTAIPLPIASRFYTLHVAPEPEYPFGRKGLGLARAWQQLAAPDAAGMLLLDGDVAIDPLDYDAMLAAVDKRPGIVHTGQVRLWPVSTRLDAWVWGHGRDGYSQRGGTAGLNTFTFCFTYLPRALVEHCIGQGMEEWQYPHVDKNTYEAARELGLAVSLVADAQGKHLHY
jgi:hypothetical protein